MSTHFKRNNNRMFNQIFCYGINEFQNQVPLGNFQDRGAKWGYMIKNHCHVMTMVIKLFPYGLRNPR